MVLLFQFEFQMPPKTAKHGGARKNGGRKSKSGEFSNEKTPEEKLKSHRERMAKNRGQLKVPAARSLQYGCGNAERRCLSFFMNKL